MCINREKYIQIKTYFCCSCIFDYFVLLKFLNIKCHETIITKTIPENRQISKRKKFCIVINKAKNVGVVTYICCAGLFLRFEYYML